MTKETQHLDRYVSPWMDRWVWRRWRFRKERGRWVWRRRYGDHRLHYGEYRREWERAD